MLVFQVKMKKKKEAQSIKLPKHIGYFCAQLDSRIVSLFQF